MNGPKDPPPASDAPCRALSPRQGGFVDTLVWKPGFDDAAAPAAGGTEPYVFDIDVKYDPPHTGPAQVFLAMRPPHRGTSGLSLAFENTGNLLSLLLRHGWTPAQLVEKQHPGSLGRVVALYLARCPRAVWVDGIPVFPAASAAPPAGGNDGTD